MKNITKFMLFPLVIVLVILLSACKVSDKSKLEVSDGGKEDTPISEDKSIPTEPITINILLINETKSIDRIIAEYKERTKNDPIMSKINVNITHVIGKDYKNKLSLLISEQEDYDLIFIGSWLGFNNHAVNGVFADLTSYFNNDQFPGLKRAFNKDFIDAAKTQVNIESGVFESKLFCIPLAEALNDTRGLLYREDLRVKYGIPEITSDDILMDYLNAVKENEPDMMLWIMNGGFFYFETDYYSGAHDNVFWQEIFGVEAQFYVALNADATKVINAVIMGDNITEFEGLPKGYNFDFITAYHLEHLKWSKFLLETRGDGQIIDDISAVRYGALTEWEREQNKLLSNEEYMTKYPNASWRFYVTEERQRNREVGAVVSEMKSNNFLAVPSWSDKKNETMNFMNWLFGSRENHDLFQFGVEGTDWEAVGDNGYKTIQRPETETYKMPGYSFTWNPTYIRYSQMVTNNTEIKERLDYQNSLSTYIKSPIAGFVFDTRNVQTEIATITALSELLQLRFAIHGDDTEAVIKAWHEKAVEAGLETVRQELIKQLQNYLNMKNN